MILQIFKKSLIFIIWILIFVYTAVALLPKNELYYKAEHILEKYKVYINNEKLDNRLFSFKINDANVAYTDIKIAKIDNISFNSYVFYNSIEVPAFELDESLALILPAKVEFIKIKNSIIQPSMVTIESQGEFGKASGFINLRERKIYIEFVFAPIIKTRYRQALRVLKRTKEGYKYESSF